MRAKSKHLAGAPARHQVWQFNEFDFEVEP
jgi:hypothetical protein